MTVEMNILTDALVEAGAPLATPEGLVVPTTTLLPGGRVACVLVSPDERGSYSVSDNGSGRESLLDQGVSVVSPWARKRATKLAESIGASLDGDAFVFRDVAADQLTSAISYVADVSRSWAQYVLEHVAKSRSAEVLDIVRDKLERAYTPSRVRRKVPVLGASTMQYEFDFSVELDGSRVALFEIVAPSLQSLAFAHTKFSDVARLRGDWAREAIVEDISAWSSDQTSLLAQVATHIRSADVPWHDLPQAA